MRGLPALVAVAALLPASAAHAAPSTPAAVRSQPNVLPTPDPISPTIFLPVSQTVPPPSFTISARQAIAVADRTKVVQRARRSHPGLKPLAYISPLPLRIGRFYHWDIIYSAEHKRWVEVEMGRGGLVLETQTYPDVGWPLLRGYPRVLGQMLNAPYIWLPLCLLFLLPFFDPRRPWRLLHLDMLVLVAGFGLSHFFFNQGRPDLSVPLVYPFLIYVGVRLAIAGLRPRRRSGALVPYLTTNSLLLLVLAGVALRIYFGVTGSNTFDISSAGVIGADRIEHGLQLYVFNDVYGDTYGPINYLAYIPAELIFPIPRHAIIDAARATTLMLDVLVTFALFLLGRVLRPAAEGIRLGLILSYAWVAFPYSALVIASNTNDALVPLFVIFGLMALRSPPGRGLLAGLATMAKFVPGFVVPLLVTGRGPFRLRSAAIAGACWALVCAGLVLIFLPAGGLHEFWNTTLGFQLHRTTPLSLWTRAPGLTWLRPVVQAVVVGLALVVAFVPARRTVGQVAALCGALFALSQISTNYWLYFYIVWFAPFLFIGLFEEYRDLGPLTEVSPASRAPS